MADAGGIAPPTEEIVSLRGMLLGSGPRFARDAFGPVLVFYVMWKVGGLAAGVISATVVALAAWWWERSRERPGLMARISLALVIIQAVIGLVADDAKVYLAQPVLVSGIYGLVFLGSALVGRPLAGAFADEVYPFPPEVRASKTFRTVFGRISLAWGGFLLLRSVLRMVTLSSLSIDGFVAINFLTGPPLTAGLIAWSMWYGRRGFARSEEWGWAFAAPTPVVPAVPAP